ncbi:MAG TPA: TonB-dependent receptor, partial [Steroidobacter sp.]|nr:TonB-dependent receptor [Steroidobacter sp.]
DVLNASMGSYVDRASDELVDPWSTPYALHSDRTSDTQSFNLIVTGGFPLFGRDHDVVFGFNGARNEFTLLSTYADLPTYHLSDSSAPAPDFSQPSSPYDASGNRYVSEQSGLFGTVRLSLHDRLKLMAGGRVSNWKLRSTDLLGVMGETTAKRSDVYTPYFGVVFDLNSFASVYASHTGIFLPSTNHGADGNLLEPTEGTNDELGIKLAFYDNRLNVSAAVYEANKDNVPEFANQGMLPNGEWIYVSLDGIKTRGYEIELAGALTPSWEIGGGFTHNTAEDRDGNPRTTYIPNDVFKLTTSYRLDQLLPGVTVGGSARWQSSTYYDFSIDLDDASIPVRQQQSAYWLIDLMARYTINEAVSVSVNVNNVFDKLYNRSIWGYADYGDPRNASISIRWKM